MKVARIDLASQFATVKVERKDKPQPKPEPNPLEKVFWFILIEHENMKKSGKPKS
jgi:hypothetical protein